MSGRLSLPGEWVPHERTIMFWPCRESMWGSFFAEVQDESARVANTIAEFEPVTMVAADEAGAAVARQCLHPATDIRVIPMDGSWSRDNGPIYVTDGQHIEARHVVFNSYGERHAKRDRDARAGATLAEQLGHRVEKIDVVMEGGAIATNGRDTLVATEHCVLNPNRNWHLDKETVTERLLAGFGLDRIERELDALTTQRWWPLLPAVMSGDPDAIVLVDGNQMFNRPGPRLVDAFRWLVGWLNDRPELVPPRFPVQRLADLRR
jgi:agmatine deiminase